MKLTKRVIDAMEYEGKDNSRDVRWDDAVPGFGVRIYPTGRKAFVVSYRVSGRKRLMTLRDQRVLTVDEARSKARKVLANLDQVDPLEARQRLAKGKTVKNLCESYLENYAKPRKRSWKTDQAHINQHIIPAIGNLKVIDIKRADIAALHRQIGLNAPYEANRMLATLSKIFELATEWGFLPEGSNNPARKIEKFKEHKRDRWVTPEELPKLTQAIDEEENTYAHYALWLYLLTGARKTELLQARWDNVDWSRKELKIPETKAGHVHYVPLSEPAVALLKEIPKLESNPFILPGHKKHAHMVNIDKPWKRVRDRATVLLWANQDGEPSKLVAELTETLKRPPTRREVETAADFELPVGIRDVRLHDLRRTVGSWLAQAGNSLHLIGRVLNHSNQSTTAIYARFGQDQVRQALEQHGERIMGIARKKEPGEVINLRK
jgi:integrase